MPLSIGDEVTLRVYSETKDFIEIIQLYNLGFYEAGELRGRIANIAKGNIQRMLIQAENECRQPGVARARPGDPTRLSIAEIVEVITDGDNNTARDESREVLHFETRSAYGTTRIYPKGKAKWVTKLTDTKTVNTQNLRTLCEAGFQPVIDGEPFEE